MQIKENTVVKLIHSKGAVVEEAAAFWPPAVGVHVCMFLPSSPHTHMSVAFCENKGQKC